MRSSRNQSSMIHAAVIEAVEARQMFAATAFLSAGVLTITGTTAADNITVSKDVANLKVKLSPSLTKTYAYAAVTKIVASLGNGNDTFTSDNSVVKKMSITGGNDNDTITSGGAADSLYGNAGKDRLTGLDSGDILYGGSGNDTVNGNGGVDVIYDEAGKDNHFGGSSGDYFFADKVNTTESDLFDGGDGVDFISYAGRSQGVRIQTDGVANDGYTGGTHGPGVELDNVFGNIEILVGTDHEDGIYAHGTVNNNIVGGKGADYITAGPGNDTVTAGDGNDFVFGESGNDSINGGAGTDFLDGGSGNDTIVGGSGKD
ncbi:MAG: hypothetical protein H7144_13870, partial [Burkholderiales bacterium]|nr:hypothetical protein [Phycisphaerae bacterium]